MKTREETTKIRRELIQAERNLAQAEKPKAQKPNLMPIGGQQVREDLVRKRPQSMSEIPGVISPPPKKRPKHENRPW